MHLRCMRKPLVAKSGHGDGWSVELDGGGGSARRGLAGASRPGFSRGYRPRNLTPKGPGVVAGAHRGLLVAGDVAQKGRRRGSAAESVRWPWTGWCGAPPGSWAARIDDWWRCEANQGVSVARVRPAARNRERKSSPAAAGGSASTPGTRAARLRVLGWRRGGDGVQGVRLRAKRRGPEIWACGMGRGITARITAVIREAVERGRVGEGGPGKRARMVSERG